MSFLAWITPVPQGLHPSHPIVLPPDQPPTQPGVPTHPIVIPPTGPVDPGWGIPVGGTPSHPIELPPVPPDLKPEHPIVLPPGVPTHPIFIPVEPAHPIALPPGSIWPPLPCDSGVGGKGVLLANVVGVGLRWLSVDLPAEYPPGPGQK